MTAITGTIMTAKKKIALIGRALGHSYSPELHTRLGMDSDYSYTCVELEPEELEAFFASNPYDGFNVTIPYKKAVLPFLSSLSAEAERLGSVNTVLKTENGYSGDNTDYAGFSYLLRSSGFDVRGKKALILGNGGVSPTVRAVLEDAGAKEIAVISHKENTDETLSRHGDTALLVNASPVGMYPHNLESPADLAHFPSLACVLDLIYNPFETALLRQARLRGIRALGGISMLTAQAKRAAELFSGHSLPDARTEQVTKQMIAARRNVILIGMPGCGKSTLGKCLADTLGRNFVDLDTTVEALAGKPIPAVFAEDGEAAFREFEHRAVCEVCSGSGQVIACGGGVVVREDNLAPMEQNGVILFLDRDTEKLPTDGRPLSLSRTPEVLYRERLPKYLSFADGKIDNNGTPEETLRSISAFLSDCRKFE